MTSPIKPVLVKCPRCGADYFGYERASFNFGLGEHYSEEYIREMGQATCDDCGHTVELDAPGLDVLRWSKPDGGGRVVIERRSRSTGLTVQLYDRGTDDFERQSAREEGYEWLRWETICVEHGTVCSHPTRALAESFLAVPAEWCEVCAA